MQIEKFKEFLRDKGVIPEYIEDSITLIQEFDIFLSKSDETIEKLEIEDLNNFSAFLIQNGRNTYANYISLLHYGYFTRTNNLIIASMELLDGREMITNFSTMILEKYDEEIHKEIFEGIEIPPLGLHPKKRRWRFIS